MIPNSVLRFGIKVILTAAAVIIVSSGSSYSNPFNSPAPGMNYAGLPSAEDSIVFQNDSVFTIEGVKEELQKDGEWIKVTKAEIDPEGVTDGGDFDNGINTEYVWRPYNMEPGWSPYTNGHWRYTRCGWMWVSHYHWGWRPYHYGRWWWSDYYGWVWSPGFIFAPAWVVWIINDGYCGWYPISPRVRWHHHHGWRCHKMRYRTRHWTFCEKKRFADPLITPGVIVDPMHNPSIIKTGTYTGNVNIVNDQVVNEGPSVVEIENVTGTKQVNEDVSKYNNTNRVKEIMGTGDNGQKDPRLNDGNVDNGRKTESYSPPNDKNDNGWKETYTPPNDKNDNGSKEKYTPPKDNSDNGRKDTYTPPPKIEEKKESYKQPPKNDNGTKKDSYSPPKDNNDNGKKNDNSGKSDNKSNDNSKNNGKK